ncbi:DNA-binding protein Ikaros-like isoform X1 [Dysidea avara]|uniref:DNA-binding protein Ikaros-like isoform X1 n=1 Tax=Dysidea avara TaxID=196820 RepID=UPI00331950A5
MNETTTVMDCDKNQLSTMSSEKEDCYLNIDLTKPEDIFDFSARSIPKPTSRSLESQLILVIKPPPKLSELTASYNKVQVINDQDGSGNERRFQCNQCKKTFIHLPHLKRHIFTHTGERPYCCRVCNNRYLRSDYLLSHIRRHKRNKEHNCCVCNKIYHCKWNEFIMHCLTHDVKEYLDIMQATDATMKLFLEKKSTCSTDTQDGVANDLQKEEESPTSPSECSFYQATIGRPIYSSNCRPLSTTSNHTQNNTIPYCSSTYIDQCLPHNDISSSHQPTLTLFYQQQQPMPQSSLQDNFNQPPKLIHMPLLEPINSIDYATLTYDHYCYANCSVNVTVSPTEYRISQEQQSILQSDDMIQPPHLIQVPPLQPIYN